MRAIMSLDDKTRAKIIHPNNLDDNFDHLKIECRAKDKHNQHEEFGDQLFNIMKSVKEINMKIFLRKNLFSSF
jgi:hypothetical protein